MFYTEPFVEYFEYKNCCVNYFWVNPFANGCILNPLTIKINIWNKKYNLIVVGNIPLNKAFIVKEKYFKWFQLEFHLYKKVRVGVCNVQNLVGTTSSIKWSCCMLACIPLYCFVDLCCSFECVLFALLYCCRLWGVWYCKIKEST